MDEINIFAAEFTVFRARSTCGMVDLEGKFEKLCKTGLTRERHPG